MSETTFKTKVLKHIKKQYPSAWAYKSSDRFTVGIPDIIGVFRGKFFALELKFGKNKATPLQIWTIKQIKKAGGLAGVCYTIEDVDKILRRIK